MSQSQAHAAKSGLSRGASFSWRRAIGLSQAQARISRQIGVPLSRSGRQQKLGRIAFKLIAVMALVILALGATLVFNRPDAAAGLLQANGLHVGP
jgi:hypothetical protein